MQSTTPPALAGAILMFIAVPAAAGPCTRAIERLQARLDAAIDSRAGAGPSMPESLSATRNYQPTPGSIAAAEGAAGRNFRVALNLLDRARTADRAGNPALCDMQLDKARRALER
ncbi:MAG: hypothetical protein P4M07_20030 [Xanthobacteraceae bacterium]|nr:hypothetical protein [Xanthobacteraceae bacterium]